MSLANQILLYNTTLDFTSPLPEGIHIMNPFKESEFIEKICTSFYHKFYQDSHQRYIILGINPGRLGAGATGLPFTDSKRLVSECDLENPGFLTHEPSSVFMYEMINAFGGVKEFYAQFYINSVFPLGFIKKKADGKVVNYNYYDDIGLQKMLIPYIVNHLQHQIKMCRQNKVVFCLGSGKNFNFLNQLNKEYKLFDEVVPLEHPRYIMQYKLKQKSMYIDQYLTAFATYIQ
ncbi:MAG: uracil-DNA glycosylase family protein [Saprospiraceae bacterium]